MTGPEIIQQLPYCEPFLFVDEILSVDSESIVGKYHFHPDLEFYNGHFKNQPVTPGVLLTECMAQIGLACFGIFLMKEQNTDDMRFVFTQSEVEFLAPVYPDQTVVVKAQKIYFRFGKLKCRVSLENSSGQFVCKGTLSGMLISNPLL